MIPADRMTVKAAEALQAAAREAKDAGNPAVEDVHLLAALLDQDETIVGPVLQKSGVRVAALRDEVREALERLPTQSGAGPSVSRELNGVFDEAAELADGMGDRYVATEHLLVALAGEGASTTGPMLEDAGVTQDQIRDTMEDVRGPHGADDQQAEQQYRALERFGRDLTEQARKGDLDPVIGRDQEIRRIMQVLSRRTKNNPVLIGEPGVGKTAIVEGLAQRIVEGDVPDSLRDKELVRLDISSMLAGAKYRGEFEERFKSALEEITESEGRYVVFIDELHTIVGAGAAEGAVDAGNMLKPPLARGELRMIGATTLDEYRQNIEKDAALERRFQPVLIGEPDVEETIGILRGLKERYEVHHGVRISDPALVAAARLSDRYIGERFLPDKAIDVVDEAASQLRIEIDSMPQEIDEVQRRITQLEIEKEALKEEDDPKSRERLDDLEEELAELREELAGKKSTWLSEREAIDRVRELKREIEQKEIEAKQATREGSLNRAAEIQHGEIPDLRSELAEAEERLGDLKSSASYLKEEVGPEDVAGVVASWTGIPVSKMMESEKERLRRLEEHLHRRVVNQDHAITAVANAVRRSRTGLQDPDRPIGSFIFLGPTGVGKTETARALAEFLFDDEEAMVRLDMSEYMERHSVARLIGAPPGYVGHEEGGQLTEPIRRRPYSVVLYDEIEKAHPEVFNTLLQILDDGRLTDSQGRTVDFRNTVQIMTSNVGSSFILEHAGDEDWDGVEEEVRGRLGEHFRPEFLNRIDDTLVYRPLSREHIREIVDLQLRRLEDRLSDREITLEVTPGAKSRLAEVGYDPAFGARPLKRAIQRLIENPLAMEFLEDRFEDGDRIRVEVDEEGDGFRFERAEESEPAAATA